MDSCSLEEAFANIVPSIGWVFGVLTGTSIYEFTPVTYAGKILNVLMVLSGVVVVGLPIGILTGSFVAEIAESKRKPLSPMMRPIYRAPGTPKPKPREQQTLHGEVESS